jgi:CheY-like chemotaxis protein
VTLTLLAVDDSKTMRKVVEITFAGEDCRTLLSDSPLDALAKLRAERPTIALVDAILGAGSGYDLCQELKAEQPNLGVIIVSSKQHPYDRSRGAAVGADDFIDKPFDTQALIDKVASVSQKVSSQAVQRPMQPSSPLQAPPSRPLGAPPLNRPNPPFAAGLGPRPATVAGVGPGLGSAPVASQAPVQPAQPAMTRPVAPAPMAPAPAPAPVVVAQPAAHAAAPAAPMPVAAVGPMVSVDAALESKLAGLGLTAEQMRGVLALSREVVEQVVWEVVPVLAETMIREEIRRLTTEA